MAKHRSATNQPRVTIRLVGAHRREKNNEVALNNAIVESCRMPEAASLLTLLI